MSIPEQVVTWKREQGKETADYTDDTETGYSRLVYDTRMMDFWEGTVLPEDQRQQKPSQSDHENFKQTFLRNSKY